MGLRYRAAEKVLDLESEKSNGFNPLTVNIANTFNNNSGYTSNNIFVQTTTAAGLGVLGTKFDREVYTLSNQEVGSKFSHQGNVRLVANNVFHQIGRNAYRLTNSHRTLPRYFAGISRYTL